jgi:acetyl esterase/lipase
MSDDILTLAPPAADARLSYGSDPNQFLDLRLPKSKGPHPTVINLHGGFWRAKYSLDHAGHLCAALTAKGLATANVEYRRVGNESGGWPNTFADVRGAYQFLRQDAKQYDLDAQKFVVMGHSAGAQLAFCLAAHETSLRRVVSLAGVVDLQRAYQLHLSNNAVVEFLHGTPTEVPDHYREADPMQLSIPQGSEWLIHGGVDDIVPPAFSRDYVASKQKRSAKDREDVQLLEIPAAGHFELIDPRTQAWKQVEQTVMRLLT